MFRNNIFALYAHVLVAWMLTLAVTGPVLAADPNGLVAHWAMEGSAADAGPHSLDGTLLNGAGFGTGLPPPGRAAKLSALPTLPATGFAPSIRP